MNIRPEETSSKPASIRASADSATVTVLPLPAQGQPDTFTGAVGRFRVEAESDASNVPVGDVATIDVTVRGDGNLETTGAPVLEPVPGLRIASPRRTNVNLDLSSTTAVGSATWAIDVIPQTEGRHALGPVRLDYFDPSTERYAVAQSGRLEINAGPRPIAPQTAASPSPTSTTWYGWLAAAVGLGLVAFKGYRQERIERGEDISGLEGAALITPRWWGVLAVGGVAGLVNFGRMSGWW